MTAALAAALVAVVTVLASAGALLVHPCLPGDGLVGAVGLRLAVVGPDAECPVGTLAIGADGAQAARLVVLVALPVLVAHLTAALAGLSVLVAARSLWRGVRSAVLSLARRLPVAARVVRRAVRTLPPARAGEPVVRPAVADVRRRGPPALLPA